MAAIVEYVATLAEAEALRDQWRRSGYYRRVQVYPRSKGTEYKICGWMAR
jgi:hypothetical protein